MREEAFVHFRLPKIAKDNGAIVYPDIRALTIAYRFLPDDDGKWAAFGLSFCSPQEKCWDRKKSCSISRSRLKDSPILLRFEGFEPPLRTVHIVSALRAIIIENPKWEHIDDQVLRPGRFTQRWGATLIGPDGCLLTAYFDFKNLLRGIPRDHAQIPRPLSHWILRAPTWCSDVLER